MTSRDPLPTLMAFIRLELLGDASRELTGDEDLLGSGLIDSMGIMRLVAFLESEFALSVPPEDVTIEHFETPRTISAYLSSAIGTGN